MHPSRRLRPLLLAVFAVSLGAIVRADIEFVGLYATTRSTQFVLGDTATGRTSWVALGGSFAGWTLVSHDPKSDTLLLRRDGRDQTLRLKEARVKDARLELTGEIKFGAAAATTVTRATLLFDQENVFPLQDGQTYRITPTRQPDGTHVYEIVIEKTEADGSVKRMAAPRVKVLPGNPFALQVGDFGFSFSPKSP